jgi:two-component system vancomycin resistance associated response regulator VraR
MDRTIAGENVYPDNTPQLKLGDTWSERFSERELEVLRLVVAGETDAAIAEKLFISVATVKTHVQNVKNRTGFRNRTELAVRARESGLVIFDQKPTE